MIRLDVLGEAVKRTTGVQQPNGDRTFIFFYRPNITPSSANYLTQFYWGDDPATLYTEYVGIFSDDTDSDKLKLYVSDGVTTEISVGATFDVNKFRTIMYRKIGNDHEFWVNGVLIDTLTLDISASTYTNLWLGDDSFGIASNHDFFQYREWSKALTDEEAKAEFKSSTVIVTDDLVADTPLFDDLDDESGAGNDWTAVGAIEFFGQPPNNLVPYTAITIDIPSTGNYNANRSDNFETFPVWFVFDNPIDNKMVSVIAYNNVGNYKPRIQPYSDETTRILNISSLNRPVQFPISGSSAYILIGKDSDELTADFSLIITPFTPIAVPRGSIAVNDDAVGFPLALMSVFTDYVVLDFILDFPAGEAGDTLVNGVTLVEDISDGSLKARNSDYTNLNTLAYTEEPRIRTCRGQNVFFVGSNANPPVIQTVNASGNFTADTWTLTGNGGSGLRALAAKNDGTLLYFANLFDTVSVKVWDLINDVYIGDLVPAVAGYHIPDILVLTDNTLIVLYYNQSTKDVFVKHYSALGVTLNTYEFGVGANSVTFPRLAYSLDNTTSFWLFFHPSSGIAHFIETNVDDGSIITLRIKAEYENGSYQESQTDSPLSKWGHSNSCPFWIVQTGETPSSPGIFIVTPGQHEIQVPTPFFKTYYHGE